MTLCSHTEPRRSHTELFTVCFCVLVQRDAAEHFSHGCLCVLPPVLLLGDAGSMLWLAGRSVSLLVSVLLGGLCDFLFLMRIFPMSSWGLGRGRPDSSYTQTQTHTHKHTMDMAEQLVHSLYSTSYTQVANVQQIQHDLIYTYLFVVCVCVSVCVTSQGICPEGRSAACLRRWTDSTQPSWPAASNWQTDKQSVTRLLLMNEEMVKDRDAHESTWFSKDRMTGKGDVLKAHSEMASITSWRIRDKTTVNETSEGHVSLVELRSEPGNVCVHLERDFWGHGEAVCDDRLLLGGASLPHVQLHAAAAGQEDLPVHLHRGAARQLARWHAQTHTDTQQQCVYRLQYQQLVCSDTECICLWHNVNLTF